MKNTGQYFKLITNQAGAVPEILLYGYIGTVYDFWGDKDEEASNTDLDFVKALSALEKQHSRINLRINSPGGNMKDGLAIVSAIRRSPSEIHTYIDGIAASMAFDIWVAGKVRHMASNALGMCHSPMSVVWGNAKAMREEADILDKFAQTTVNVLVESTDMSEAEARERFYDYADHWLTANEAKELGLIGEIENYEAQDIPTEPEKMSLNGLISFFARKGDAASKAFLKELSNIQQRISTGILAGAPAKTANHTDMTIEDFKKSLADGTLKAEDVKKLLAEQPAAAKPHCDTDDEDAAGEPEKAAAAAIEKAVQPLQAQIAALEEKLKAFGEKPAAAPTGVPADKDSGTGNALDAEFRKTMEGWHQEAKHLGNPWIGAH